MRWPLVLVFCFVGCSDASSPSLPDADAPDAIAGSDGGGGGGDPQFAADAGADGAAPASGSLGPNALACARPAPPPNPACEATSGAHCYYLDATAGDDAKGDGSDAKPWRSFANVVTYYGTPGAMGSTPKPAAAVDLKAGDYVYLKSGTYSDTYNYDGTISLAFWRGIDASASPIHVKAYPGQTPVLKPNVQATAIQLLQSKGFVIEDLEVSGAYGTGIFVAECDAVTLLRAHVHDTDGVDNDNMSGIQFLSSTHCEVACSVVHDNYDRTNADTGGMATENSSDLVMFGGGDLRIHHSSIYQTPPYTSNKTGGCIKYKHTETVPTGVFEVDHNVIQNCKFYAVGTGTQHSHVHHNIIFNGEGISSRDFGGTTHQTNQVFAFNTFYHANAFSMVPTSDYNDATFSDPNDIEFTDNVVLESRASDNQESGTLVIGTYQSDALYNATVPQLKIDRNCYYNDSGDLHFDLFAANGGAYGVLGAQYDWTGWKGQKFDTTSVQADPMFIDASHGDFDLAASSPCVKQGAYAP
jgi:hypothetical protein